MNEPNGKLPNNRNSIIADRTDNMPKEILNEYKDMTKKEGTHAEVLALNKALLERPDAELSDFMVYVINKGTKGKNAPKGTPFERCPHCEYITDGTKYFPEVIWYGKEKGRLPFNQR